MLAIEDACEEVKEGIKSKDIRQLVKMNVFLLNIKYRH